MLQWIWQAVSRLPMGIHSLSARIVKSGEISRQSEARIVEYARAKMESASHTRT